MTLREFIRLCQETMKVNPRWRRGQTYFNALYSVNPALADSIRGSGFDCFYNDQRITMFLLYLKEHWDENVFLG